MFRSCQSRTICVAAVIALATILSTAAPASAQQYLIPPDQSFVAIKPVPPVPVGSTFTVGPVNVLPGYNYVQVGGTFSGSISTPGPGTSFAPFMKPFTANDRIYGSFIYGGKNPPRTIIVGPYQRWW
jgi:hypothetical protein